MIIRYVLAGPQGRIFVDVNRQEFFAKISAKYKYFFGHLVALSKHFKRSNLAQKFFELHAWVKKCYFGNFSERAGMAVPC